MGYGEVFLLDHTGCTARDVTPEVDKVESGIKSFLLKSIS